MRVVFLLLLLSLLAVVDSFQSLHSLSQTSITALLSTSPPPTTATPISSPIQSSSTFTNLYSKTLPPWLLNTLTSLYFLTPTPIQRDCLDSLFRSTPPPSSIILNSHTGSGKTLAYLIPVFARLNVERKAVQCVITVPTVELCEQVFEVCRLIADGFVPDNDETENNLTVPGLPSNTNPDIIQPKPPASTMKIINLASQTATAAGMFTGSSPPQIIISTPKKLYELLRKNWVRTNYIHTIVLDEFDSTLNPSSSGGERGGGEDDMRRIMSNHLSKSFSRIPDKMEAALLRHDKLLDEMDGDQSVNSMDARLVSGALGSNKVRKKLIRGISNNNNLRSSGSEGDEENESQDVKSRLTIFASATIPQSNYFRRLLVKEKYVDAVPVLFNSNVLSGYETGYSVNNYNDNDDDDDEEDDDDDDEGDELISKMPPTLKHTYVLIPGNEPTKTPALLRSLKSDYFSHKKHRNNTGGEGVIVFFNNKRDLDSYASTIVSYFGEDLAAFKGKSVRIGDKNKSTASDSKKSELEKEHEIEVSVLKSGESNNWTRRDGSSGGTTTLTDFKGESPSPVSPLPPKFKVLLTTDLSSRGLDIPFIRTIYNYDLPSSPEIYVHRGGRAGRMGREGAVKSLVFGGEGFVIRRLGNGVGVLISDDAIV